MKTLTYAVFVFFAGVIMSPCLLVFNEQPDSEPQRWWINLIGAAYTGLIVLIIHKRTNKRQQP